MKRYVVNVDFELPAESEEEALRRIVGFVDEEADIDWVVTVDDKATPVE